MIPRGSGLLLHISSLPSAFGIGDLGPAAYRFVDFLAASRQRYWQILPLNPTTPEYDHSPYHSISAFAGNPDLISPDLMVRDGFLPESALYPIPDFSEDSVSYDIVLSYKNRLLSTAYLQFRESKNQSPGFDTFCLNNSWWLDDYALFVALNRHFGGMIWSEWPVDIRHRNPEGLAGVKEELCDKVTEEQFRQYLFDLQWQALHSYCREKGISVIGDLPIYVDYDGVDVWTHPELFQLDEELHRVAVSGVPPDYFSRTGQLWNNPLYRWEEHTRTGFAWWMNRMKRNLSLVDHVRIDHFRGLVAYWEVPAGAETAMWGRWVSAPADEFMATLNEHFPCSCYIAEDLGVITTDVHAIIKRFNLTGMRVLIFAFTDEPAKNPHAPHNLHRDCILYTGTHDNAPVRGWFETEATPEDRDRVIRYLGWDVSSTLLPCVLVRLAMMSVADTVIFPVQDILGLGAEARMNIPGTHKGNWRWRVLESQLAPEVGKNLCKLTEIYGRTPET
jgi:4-alpha-glucanotransferase